MAIKQQMAELLGLGHQLWQRQVSAAVGALQSGVGLVQKLPYDLSLELNLYYNRMFGLVVGREDRFRFFTGPPPSGPFDTLPYGNDGLGMTCGTRGASTI